MRKIKRLFHYLAHDPAVLANALLDRAAPLIADEPYLRMKYRLSTGRRLDLANPRTFGEKLQWLKLHDRRPEYTVMVDKVKAKDYVAGLLGREYIIPTLGVWDTPEEIDFGSLPERFVLKCNHNSGLGMYICKDKGAMDADRVRADLRRGLRQNYYLHGREWPYKDVPRKILAEQFMDDGTGGDLKDYKFFCFNGEPKYCQVISDRSNEMTVDFFDGNWEHQPFHEPRVYPFARNGVAKPENYETMWCLAGVLAKGMPFVRIDFYNLKGKIYFGEITFFPTSGMGGFDPEEWDEKFGDMIDFGMVVGR